MSTSNHGYKINHVMRLGRGLGSAWCRFPFSEYGDHGLVHPDGDNSGLAVCTVCQIMREGNIDPEFGTGLALVWYRGEHWIGDFSSRDHYGDITINSLRDDDGSRGFIQGKRVKPSDVIISNGDDLIEQIAALRYWCDQKGFTPSSDLIRYLNKFSHLQDKPND